MSSNSSSVRCSNPINALFALLTRMSSSNFTLNRGGVTVLLILELPGVREPEERTGNRPDHHGPESKGKHPGSTYFSGANLCALDVFTEQLARALRKARLS